MKDINVSLPVLYMYGPPLKVVKEKQDLQDNTVLVASSNLLCTFLKANELFIHTFLFINYLNDKVQKELTHESVYNACNNGKINDISSLYKGGKNIITVAKSIINPWNRLPLCDHIFGCC